MFYDWVDSIEEAGVIKRKEIQGSRVTALELPDIKEVRKKTGLSQSEFAARLHISARTLQNWERATLPNRASSDFNPYFRCTSKPDLKDIDNNPRILPGVFILISRTVVTLYSLCNNL